MMWIVKLVCLLIPAILIPIGLLFYWRRTQRDLEALQVRGVGLAGGSGGRGTREGNHFDDKSVPL